jgi:hypothetical protein
MIHEYKANLIALSQIEVESVTSIERWKALIYRDMDTFKYLSYQPIKRRNLPCETIFGLKKGETLAKAKAHLDGQLELF